MSIKSMNLSERTEGVRRRLPCREESKLRRGSRSRRSAVKDSLGRKACLFGSGVGVFDIAGTKARVPAACMHHRANIMKRQESVPSPRSCPGANAVMVGAVFWRRDSTDEDTSGKGHYWVVVIVSDRCHRVLWVPLSSYKEWLDPAETYRFNIGKKNKYLNAKRDSCPRFKFAEVATVCAIKTESPPRRGRLPLPYINGIRGALVQSGETPEEVRVFYEAHGG